jgi:uncharacterized protein
LADLDEILLSVESPENSDVFLFGKTMIIEAIVSTLDESGAPNFAPMGVILNDQLVTVRPYRNTRTCRNLLSSSYGVVNFSDDALAYVQCGLYHAVLPHFPASAIPGVVYRETCSWQEMVVVSQMGSDERAELQCRVLHKGLRKEFLGFCRARNAVIEATILATRLDFCDPGIVSPRLIQYHEIIEKTGGVSEKQAFQLVRDFVKKRGSDD